MATLPPMIAEALRKQGSKVVRRANERAEVLDALKELGLDAHAQPREFYLSYRMGSISTPRAEELLDICLPTRSIRRATEFARSACGVGAEFVSLTSGEGEGFLLYSLEDGSVFDVESSEIERLNVGDLAAAWPDFGSMLMWYLGVAPH